MGQLAWVNPWKTGENSRFDSGLFHNKTTAALHPVRCVFTPNQIFVILRDAGWGVPNIKKEAAFVEKNKAHMNVNEVIADMRQHGFKMSPKKFNMMTDAGLLPFVHVLSVSACGRRNLVIRRKDYVNWRDKELEVNV